MVESTGGNLTVNSSTAATLVFPRKSPNLTYSRSRLLYLRRMSTKQVSSCCFSQLKELNIFRIRGKSGGSHSRESSVKTCPPSPTGNRLNFCLLNSRSINNKSLQIKDYIV